MNRFGHNKDYGFGFLEFDGKKYYYLDKNKELPRDYYIRKHELEDVKTEQLRKGHYGC
jgi:hypothetical protein